MKNVMNERDINIDHGEDQLKNNHQEGQDCSLVVK